MEVDRDIDGLTDPLSALLVVELKLVKEVLLPRRAEAIEDNDDTEGWDRSLVPGASPLHDASGGAGHRVGARGIDWIG